MLTGTLTGALTGSQQCDVVTLRGKARDSDDVLQQSHPAGDRPPSKITMLVPVGSEFTFTDVVPDSFFTLQSSPLINNTHVSITENVTLVEKNLVFHGCCTTHRCIVLVIVLLFMGK